MFNLDDNNVRILYFGFSSIGWCMFRLYFVYLLGKNRDIFLVFINFKVFGILDLFRLIFYKVMFFYDSIIFYFCFW